eukprot:10320135-Karenia_brevis.AAC.1
MHVYPYAERHIRISSDGKVFFRHAESFSNDIAHARHTTLAEQAAFYHSIAASPYNRPAKVAKAKNKVTYLSSIMKQWVPSQRYLVITAVLAEDTDEIVATDVPSILS